jgi:hypothetical protein
MSNSGYALHEKWMTSYRQLQSRVGTAIGTSTRLRFCKYETRNDLHDIPIKGPVMFFEQHDSFWGKGKDYKSEVIDSPTWLEIAKLAHAMIETTGDYQHIYLEDVYVIKCNPLEALIKYNVVLEGGTQLAAFRMGS